MSRVGSATPAEVWRARALWMMLMMAAPQRVVHTAARGKRAAIALDGAVTRCWPLSIRKPCSCEPCSVGPRRSPRDQLAPPHQANRRPPIAPHPLPFSSARPSALSLPQTRSAAALALRARPPRPKPSSWPGAASDQTALCCALRAFSRRPSIMISIIIKPTPTTRTTSATLNTGHRCCL